MDGQIGPWCKPVRVEFLRCSRGISKKIMGFNRNLHLVLGYCSAPRALVKCEREI